MKKLGSIIIGVLVASGAVILLAAAWAGNILESGLEQYGSTVLGTPVQIGDTDMNLFAGRARFQELAIDNPETFSDQPAVEAAVIDITLIPVSLLSDTVRIDRVRIDRPTIRLEISPKGTNLDVLRRYMERYTEDPSGNASGKTVIIGELRITGASVSAAPGDLGERAEFPIPDIVLTDLGGKNGLTGTTLTRRLVEAVYLAVLEKMKSPAVIAEVGNIFDNADQVRRGMKRTIDDIKEEIDDRARQQLQKLFDR